MRIYLFSTFFLLLTFYACKSEKEEQIQPNINLELKTKHIILLVIDGPRLIDTWTNTSTDHIPYQRELKKQGTLFNNFYNNGFTYTLPGHGAITTGYYENIRNDGSETPSQHSMFQQYLSNTQLPPTKSCIIASKKKLSVLGNCQDLEWRNSYAPFIDAEDREDSVTFRIAKEVLKKHQPSLTMIHFKGPDVAGHGNRWNEYLLKIEETDEYIKNLWDFIQDEDKYRGQTALFVTNDHGRHLDDVRDGFISHGDRCEGCRHISLLALGPDFKQNELVDEQYEQIDLAPTIASLLNFPWQGEGKKINQLIP